MAATGDTNKFPFCFWSTQPLDKYKDDETMMTMTILRSNKDVIDKTRAWVLGALW